MSRLEYFSRPLVAFDPSNKQHRRYYADYLEYGGWGLCPVRFIVPEDCGMDLPTMIRNSLVEYYVTKEFPGTKLSEERADALVKAADELYRKAGQMRKEAASLIKKPD
jgi:hypothetical protein